MKLAVGDEVMGESGKPPNVVFDPHKVVEVRDNGKVMLRSTKWTGSKAVTVWIDNIGSHRNSGKTYYLPDVS